jgi:hypothetical protein
MRFAIQETDKGPVFRTYYDTTPNALPINWSTKVYPEKFQEFTMQRLLGV